MPFPAKVRELYRSVFHRKRVESDLDDELLNFVDDLVARKIAAGIGAKEARRSVLAEVGGIEQVKEGCREVRPLALIESVVSDIVHAARTLRKSSIFSAVTIASLALGIGANTAIFSFVDAVLLKPLPYSHPEQIVSVWEKNPHGVNNVTSTLNFIDWSRQGRCFQSLAAVAGETMTLTGSDSPSQVNVQRVSLPYFKVLGTDPELGRTFASDEGQTGKDREVVLSNAIWRSRFGGDPSVIGRQVVLDTESYTIVGVLPAGSFDRAWGVMWLPLAFRPADMTRNYHWLTAIARLADGVTLDQARVQMDEIGARTAAAYPDSNEGWGVTVDPYIDQIVQPQLRRSLWVLFAAVGAVLLICCANLANLMLARGARREREVAIRSALGARRLRLIQQLLTENILLGILGSVAGLALGDALMRGIQLWVPPDMLPAQANIGMNDDVLLFTMGIGVFTGILFGLAPALTGTRPDLVGFLKAGGPSTAGLHRHRMRTALVIAEVALSFVLLAVASLLIRSFNRFAGIDTGVDTTRVLAMDLPIPPAEFTNGATLTNYLTDIVENVRSVPGVSDAAITDRPPMEGYANGAPFRIEGQSDMPYAQRTISGFKIVSPSYFQTVGMRLLKGRGLEAGDIAAAPAVAVINETMAKTYFKGEDPIGKRILVRQLVLGQSARGPDVPWQVVGLVKDEKVGGQVFSLDQDIPVIYVSLCQSPGTRNSLVVRADLDPSLLSKSIEAAIWRVNKNQAVANMDTLEEIKSKAVASTRFRTVLLAIFAGIAVLLAVVGIYGVVSYSVSQRVNELAIRVALGASPGDLLKLVIGKAALTVLAGLALGAAAAFASTRVLASLLYETSPTEPATWIVAATLLLIVALLACYLPARRVTKVALLTSLRHE